MTTRKRDPLLRSLQILKLILNHQQRVWGVREIARHLDMAPSTSLRLLQQLEMAGLVAIDEPSGRYDLGPEFYRMAFQANARQPAREIGTSIVTSLSQLSGETALLGLFSSERMQMTFVASAESPHPLRYVIALNEWIPVHLGASGLGILAFLPEGPREHILDQLSLNSEERTKLKKAIDEARTAGYAFSIGQRIPGAVGMAAPVWDATGHVLGDIVITIPEQRFELDKKAEVAALLLSHSAEMTRRLGGQAPPI